MCLSIQSSEYQICRDLKGNQSENVNIILSILRNDIDCFYLQARLYPQNLMLKQRVCLAESV